MNCQRSRLVTVSLAVFVTTLAMTGGLRPRVASADLSSFAIVRDDGTLRVKGRTIHLYGIHIPSSENQCLGFQNPQRCGNRAALALEFRKGANFVRCETRERHPNGSLTALCRVKDLDLSAYLLERGWALALPEAPFEYHALEKIARHRGLGLWGIPIDNAPPPRGPR